MTPPLFLLDEAPAADEFVLDGDEGRHAARAMRIGVDEHIQVGDGRGLVLQCQVVAVLADGLSLTVLSRQDVPEADPRLVVVQALPKGDRGELAVEMMTELGVDEIVPWAASRSIAQWQGPRGEKALAKWRRTAREATKQSRRPRVPTISPLASTTTVAARAAAALVLHEGATESLAGVPLPVSGELVVIIGPEGGVAPDELTGFVEVGAAAVRLGNAVLRTSTAGAAAVAVLSLRLGRWG